MEVWKTSSDILDKMYDKPNHITNEIDPDDGSSVPCHSRFYFPYSQRPSTRQPLDLIDATFYPASVSKSAVCANIWTLTSNQQVVANPSVTTKLITKLVNKTDSNTNLP